MTRGPAYLSRLGFTLRQREHALDREIMLVIGVYFPDIEHERGYDSCARFATTTESITEALRVATNACDGPTSWWTKVVVCFLHSDTTTSYDHGLGVGGMQLRCDEQSEHCSIAPQAVNDVDNKIYAHLWEHTTARSKFTWDRKGLPSMPSESDTPLQLIQCQYTARAGPLGNLGSKEHLEPFINMLDARSCISIPAGEKMNKYDILNAYVAARRGPQGARCVDSLRSYPKGVSPDAFGDSYGGVPTRVYQVNAALKFKEGRRPISARFNALFA